MSKVVQERRRVNVMLILITAVAWLMLVVNPGGIMSISHCPVTESGASPASFQMMLEMNPLSSLMTGWALMLVAMMLPTLIVPIHHVRERSFKRRRVRAVILFLAGYAAIWMAAGAVLLMAVLVLNVLAPHSYLPGAVVAVIALVWQCSPQRQRCLNRNHNHRELAAFGAAADRDALHFGVTHGVWCVASGWALMVLPMLLLQWHDLAMIVVTYIMVSEHLEHPRVPSWRLHFPGKLMRIAVAQTRIRFAAAPSGG